ncbi:MAG: sporulation protein YabP [Oscillospiraceae bacterium]|nr:sporulation protein YabP [Oscillospiraceae bacterium]
MAMTIQEERTNTGEHRLTLDGRKQLTATGVSNVDSFDEETIVAYTSLGELTIRGQGLKINRLNVETGELTVDGDISAMVYTDNQPRSTGLLKKLFR